MGRTASRFSLPPVPAAASNFEAPITIIPSISSPTPSLAASHTEVSRSLPLALMLAAGRGHTRQAGELERSQGEG